MKDRKKWGIIFLSIILLLLVTTVVTHNLSSMRTDSGWDTSYDGGGSSSSSDGDGGDLFFLIYLILEYPIIGIPLCIFLIYSVFASMHPKKITVDPNTNIQYIQNLHFPEEEEKIILRAYQVFYETQLAWMNFDYPKLQNLLTDELYNMYKTQLEALELKGQRNIMSDFRILSISLNGRKEEEGVDTTEISLSVSFYDYVVDASNKVVRGKDRQRVTMFYRLTFVSKDVELDICPNCGAPLTTPNYCDYCKSPLQGVSKEMRLSKKEVLHQRMGG